MPADLDSRPKIRLAEPHEDAALMELWTSAFSEPASVFSPILRSTPRERHFALVADLGGRFVASVQVFMTPIRDEAGNVIELGGIANVSTHPDFRNRGYNGQLLQASVGEMTARGGAWSYLFTGIPDYYAKFGWKPVAYSTASAPLTFPPSIEVGARAVTEDDLPSCAELYAATHDKHPLTQVRTVDDWKYKIWSRLPNRLILRGDASYVFFTASDGVVSVSDYGSTDEAEVATLMGKAAIWGSSNGMEKIQFPVPMSTTLYERLEEMLPDLHRENDPNGMVRPLSESWPHERIQGLFSRLDARFFNLDGF